MNIQYVCEKREKLYHAVMVYEGREKGKGVSFYSSPVKGNVVEWCFENSSPSEGEE